MMEMEFEFNNTDHTLSGLEFVGLTGNETVFSLKEALGKLVVKNPAIQFTKRAKAGMYDNLPNADYKMRMDIVELFQLLFQDEDGKEATEINVMVLLVHALKALVQLNEELKDFIHNWEGP